MKRLLAIALTAVAACCLAFYPNATEPSGYMMVVVRTTPQYSIVTLSPSGEESIQTINAENHSNFDKQAAANMELHKAELRKINELRLSGWKLHDVRVSGENTVFYEVVYLLEK